MAVRLSSFGSFVKSANSWVSSICPRFVDSATQLMVNTRVFFTNSNQGNHFVGIDLNDAGILDFRSHGTRVSGLIVTPTYGVAKDAKLSAVKVSDLKPAQDEPPYEPQINVYPLLTAALDGADWILSTDYDPEGDLAVANFSVIFRTDLTEQEFDARVDGYEGADYQDYLNALEPFEDAIEDMLQAGIVIIAAAGNRGAESFSNWLPHRVDGVISVGGTTSDDIIWHNSNWGTHVTLFAPAADVATTNYTTFGHPPEVTVSGTSGAAPHVAAVAATLLQQFPGASPNEVRQKILATATAGKLSDATQGYQSEPPPEALPNLLLFRSLALVVSIPYVGRMGEQRYPCIG